MIIILIFINSLLVLLSMILAGIGLYFFNNNKIMLHRLNKLQKQLVNRTYKLSNKVDVIEEEVKSISATQINNQALLKKQAQNPIEEEYIRAKKILKNKPDNTNLDKLENSNMTKEEIELLADLVQNQSTF